MNTQPIYKALRITGASSLILFPLLLMIAFGMHYQNLSDFFVIKLKYIPLTAEHSVNTLMGSDANRIFINPHLVGYFAIPFMLFAALTLGYVLIKATPWFAFIGTLLSGFGTIFLGGVFSAWLSFSAIGNLPVTKADVAIDAIKVLSEMQGPLAVTTYLSVLSLIGFLVLAVGLFKSNIVPRWSAILLFIGTLFIIIFMELDNLMFIGALLMLIGFTPVIKRLLLSNKYKWDSWVK